MLVVSNNYWRIVSILNGKRGSEKVLTECDHKYFKSVLSKNGAVGLTTLFCAIPFSLACAILKFYMATLWIGMTGLTSSAFLTQMFAGTDAGKSYSGSFIRAADDVTSGIFQLTFALMFGILWWSLRRARERTQRIVNALRSAGDIL